MLLTGAGGGRAGGADGALAAALALAAGACCALALGLACVAPGMLARPHFLVLPLLALWTIALLDRPRTAQGAPRSGSRW